MPAPDTIRHLVTQFEDNRDAYRSGRYNEAQLRLEFLDPFFEALGWDIKNTRGVSPEYRDVVIEDTLDIEGTAKAPDYAFKVGRERKFYVEAKKPAVNIKEDIHPAYQLRRYAWNAHLPLSILTDFEELAVYECKNKPDPADSAATGRILFYRYTDYIEKWDEIAGIFSHDAVWKGSFDRFAEATKGKKGTTEVDDAFLQDIEEWRLLLARNIALRNPQVADEYQLNYAVQMTIDRIIFLRICEDRGIEPEGQLQEIAQSAGIYTSLLELFTRADLKYNSGLFHFQTEKGNDTPADTFTPALTIDDKFLKSIIKSIYYPCPYIFKEIPVEILGHVYEQFLGKVIRLTAGHQAKVEEKPEVRKAGGVYYTPGYIVEYIVTHTVGKLLEGKTPAQVTDLAIVDPACGSGSFLLGAFQHLLDWHLDWYVNNDPDRWARGKEPAIAPASGGGWQLTTAKKKQILVNNLYGVDIDEQAVEVTKLSLLLKVLEGESGQLTLGFERVLPDLGRNIQCGNSLIGEDYFAGRLVVEAGERRRVNPFGWQRAFPRIFARGGFDAVIGNPPWISLSGKYGVEIYSKDQIDYLVKTYQGNTYMPNMYEFFVIKGLSLLQNDGFFSFIIPDRLGFNNQFINLRKRILLETKLISLVYKAPFPNVTVDTLVYVLQKSIENESNYVTISEYLKPEIKKPQRDLLTNNYVFRYFENSTSQQLIDSIDNKGYKRLKSICLTTSGYGGKSKLLTDERVNDKQILTLKGESIQRYKLIKYFYFNFEKKNITGRTTDIKKLGAHPKILLRKTGDHIIATYDNSGVYPEQSLYFLFGKMVAEDYCYILGILNSNLLNFYFNSKSLTNKNSIAQVKKVDLDDLPIRTIDFNNPADVERHARMVALVERMLALHKKLPSIGSPQPGSGQAGHVLTPQEQTALTREIEATDRAIDALVYDLYDLTPEEIKIVEGS